MKRGMFRLLIAVFAVVAMTGTAFANQVFLKTDVPPIPKTACFQAGTITLEMDHDSQMRSGDRIVFTTNSNIPVCKNVNYFLTLVRNGDGFTRALSSASDVAVSASEGGDTISVAPSTNPNAPAPLAAGFDYGFRVTATVGSPTITVLLGRRNVATGVFDATSDGTAGDFTLTYDATAADAQGAANDTEVSSDRFVVRLFDSKFGNGKNWGGAGNPPVVVGPEFWKDNPDVAQTQYQINFTNLGNRSFSGNDNVLCLNTESYDGEFVEATPESITTNNSEFRLSFSGDYRIARVAQELDFVVKGCKNFLPDVAVQQGQVNCGFDIEVGSGFCRLPNPESTDGFALSRIVPQNNIIVEADGGTFGLNSQYTLALEILVDGQPGDNGVYFANGVIASRGYSILPERCGVQLLGQAHQKDINNDGVLETVQNNIVPTGTATYKFFNPTGRNNTEQGFSDLQPGGVQCSVPAVNKVVKIETPQSNLNLSLGTEADDMDKYLVIDVPQLTYDNSIVSPGSVVSIRVTMGQQPCSLGINGDVEIARFVESCFNTEALIYPYFTAPDGTFFDSAFVITNLGPSAGPVTLFWYEADGDAFKGTLQGEVPGNSIWNSGLLPQLIEDPNFVWEQTSGDGSQGDSMCYIVACTGFPSDGFAFIFGAPNGDSMGYIPRATATAVSGVAGNVSIGAPIPNVCR